MYVDVSFLGLMVVDISQHGRCEVQTFESENTNGVEMFVTVLLIRTSRLVLDSLVKTTHCSLSFPLS